MLMNKMFFFFFFFFFSLGTSCVELSWIEAEMSWSRGKLRWLKAAEEKFIEVFININKFGTRVCFLTSKFHKLIWAENAGARKFVHFNFKWCSWCHCANWKEWKANMNAIISHLHHKPEFKVLQGVLSNLFYNFDGFYRKNN